MKHWALAAQMKKKKSKSHSCPSVIYHYFPKPFLHSKIQSYEPIHCLPDRHIQVSAYYWWNYYLWFIYFKMTMSKTPFLQHQGKSVTCYARHVLICYHPSCNCCFGQVVLVSYVKWFNIKLTSLLLPPPQPHSHTVTIAICPLHIQNLVIL